jgi:glutamate--cysteine ligase
MRGQDENLNAPGMQFVPLAFEDTCLLPQFDQRGDCAPNRFYMYGVLARLALLAAAIEIEQLAQQYDPALMQQPRKVAGA